jgi:hypothetical protein
MNRESVSLKCPKCFRSFSVLSDERFDHNCPHCGYGERPETFGIDAMGEEIVEGDSIVIDGDETILQSNLEEYLEEMYGFKFQTAK